MRLNYYNTLASISALLSVQSGSATGISYCNWNGCNGDVQGGSWCNENEHQCVEGCGNGAQWCTGPTPSIPSPEPTGYCNWDNCNGHVQGGFWCNRNESNCLYCGQGSKWCPNESVPDPTPAPTSTPAAPVMDPIRINTGYLSGSVEDSNGNSWQGDAYFGGGGTFGNLGAVAEDPEIYGNERFFNPFFSSPPSSDTFFYSVPVPYEGEFVVVLSFTEVFCTTANCRVFKVTVEDEVVAESLDIFEESKSSDEEVLRLESTVLVSDGFVDIKFDNIIENPKINGIEIFDVRAF